MATATIELLAGAQIYHQDHLSEGSHALQTVLDLATAPNGSKMPFSGTAHALLAEAHLERNHLDAAAGFLAKGIELQRQSGIRYGLIHTYFAKARLERARGYAETARQALQAAEQTLQGPPMWRMVVHLAACQVRRLLSLGDTGAAPRPTRHRSGQPAVQRRNSLAHTPRGNVACHRGLYSGEKKAKLTLIVLKSDGKIDDRSRGIDLDHPEIGGSAFTSTSTGSSQRLNPLAPMSIYLASYWFP
jgi:hypothetical protein